MITIILPGYSQKNEKWLTQTAKKIKVEGIIRPIYWDHWTEFGKKFDVEEKAGVIISLIGEGPAMVVAKSIGTLVASLVIQKLPGKIKKVIFCGIPLNDMSEADIEKIRRALKIFEPSSILCFQNIEDPHGSFDAVKNFLTAINPKINAVSKPRSDHEYPYFDEFQDFLV